MFTHMGRFQILSLDGGGLRGMFSAAVLAKLEEKHGVCVANHFDLITGTSTGGLIALGLGLGMEPREILRFYAEAGPRVFPSSGGWRRRLQHWVYRKYPAEPLRCELKDQRVLGDRRLGESRSRLVIPAYDLAHDQVRIFKTPHHERLRTDWQVPAWQVAMATTAAPTFYPTCREVTDCRLIDGGVWANNPIVLGIAEAISILDQNLQDIHVLSLGTTNDRVDRSRSLDRGGILGWAIKNNVLDVLMRGQSEGAHGIAQHLIGPEQVTRINPVVSKVLALDRPDPDRFLHQAERVATDWGPLVQDRFFSHRAAPYAPLHPQSVEEETP